MSLRAQVTKTEMVTPTLSSFMSDVRSTYFIHACIPKYKIDKVIDTFQPIFNKVGGALGLWLGLGVLQVLQEIVTMALHFTER